MSFYHCILVLLLSPALAVPAVNVNSSLLRFLVQQSTVTQTVTQVVTLSTSSKTFCASLLSVTAACRKRRNAIDHVLIESLDEEDIKPSTPLKFVDTHFHHFFL